MRKYSGENQFLPALSAPQLENRAAFLQVGGNRHRSRNHVEQDVPLRSQQQKNNGSEAESSSHADQQQEHHRKKRSRRNRRGNLRQRLRNTRQAWVEAYSHARANR